MQVARVSLIAELEEALDCASSQRRDVVLGRLVDLFVRNVDDFSEAQIDAFDDVLTQLISEIETNALAELGKRLAVIDNAPPKLMGCLAAHEEISVAGPVLARAERLGDATLLDIAEHRSQAHLLAISVRASLSEPVTDVLVNRGNSDVIHSVVVNAG